MPSTPIPDARRTLLDKVMADVAATGLGDRSLRELATAVGTSHRMLLYHFGSRDGLVAAVVAEMEASQRHALEAIVDHARSPEDAVRTQWAQLSAPEVRPFVRLFFEVCAMAMHERPGTEGFLDSLTQPWIDVAVRSGDQLGDPVDAVDARLGVAVMRGLLLDAVASGQVDDAGAALDRFLDRWSRAGRRSTQELVE